MTKTSKIKGVLAGMLMAGSAIGIALAPTEAGAQMPSVGAVNAKATTTTVKPKVTTTTTVKPKVTTTTTVKPKVTTTTTVKPKVTTTTTTVKPTITTTTIPGTKSPGVSFFEQWTKSPQVLIDYSRCVMVQEATIRAGHESKPPYTIDDPAKYYWQWAVFNGSGSSNSTFWHIGWFRCNVNVPPTYPPTTT